MAEHELELRLRAAARELDARAPSFDVGRLPADAAPTDPRRIVVAWCCVAWPAVAAAPVAVSALRHLFDVDEVPALGPLEPGVAPPFAGRSVPVETVQASTPCRVQHDPVARRAGRGPRARRHHRRDGHARLRRRRADAVADDRRERAHRARPRPRKAEDVDVGDLPALWIEGTARGTFTLIGADGAVHRESFDVGPGVLLWGTTGMTFLLQGSGSQADAIRLAAAVDPLTGRRSSSSRTAGSGFVHDQDGAVGAVRDSPADASKGADAAQAARADDDEVCTA